MDYTALVLVVTFFLLLVLNVPISFSIGIATMAAMLMSIDFTPAVTTIAQRMAGGLDSFALLAIPCFVLSGVIMGRGGIATVSYIPLTLPTNREGELSEVPVVART